LPIRLYFLLMRRVPVATETFCKIWNWLQYTLVSINLLIIAFGSLERYLLVFHSRFLSQHDFLLRKLPLFISILLPMIFYTIGIFGIQCQTFYIYTNVGCGAPCFLSTTILVTIFKNIILVCLPVSLTVCMSCLLLIRVYIQRKKMKRQYHIWTNNLQMIIQLFPIIILYSIIWIPMSILFYVATFGSTSEQQIVRPLISDVFGNLKYLVNLIYPFLACFGQREIRMMFIRWRQQRNQIVRPIEMGSTTQKH